MGSSQFNSDVAIGLRSGFQQGRIHLLQSEYSCEDQLRKLYKGYDKMSPSERAALQMPYINTGLAINELVNLGYETVNNVIKVKAVTLPCPTIIISHSKLNVVWRSDTTNRNFSILASVRRY